jgi:hypothetical protein
VTSVSPTRGPTTGGTVMYLSVAFLPMVATGSDVAINFG